MFSTRAQRLYASSPNLTQIRQAETSLRLDILGSALYTDPALIADIFSVCENTAYSHPAAPAEDTGARGGMPHGYG